MTKHTPGPWVAEVGAMHRVDNEPIGNEWQVWAEPARVALIAAFDPGVEPRGSAEHSARLAAAAPDLLEACVEARAAFNDAECRDCWTTTGDHDETCPAYWIDLAIAKAQGQTP